MRIRLTYKCAIGPVESSQTEYIVEKEMSKEEYIQILNNPNSTINIEILEN